MSGNGSSAFVISLDFELYWGLYHKFSLEACRNQLLSTRAAIPRILDLFERYEIGATWATVGFLFFDDKDELVNHVPSVLPRYEQPHLSTYNHFDAVGRNEREDPYHFGLSLIRQIAAAPRQEVASHTFSHYYCLERGHTEEAFAADLQAARCAAERIGISMDSLVFPRNQFNPKSLATCRSMGLRVVRGNLDSWIYSPSRKNGDHLSRRGARLIDSYLPIGGSQGVHIERRADGVIVIPASRFLRSVSTTLSRMEPLRLERIKKSMTRAAETGEVFHLWWHPHNFGTHSEENLSFLEKILEHHRGLADKTGMRSASMREAAAI